MERSHDNHTAWRGTWTYTDRVMYILPLFYRRTNSAVEKLFRLNERTAGSSDIWSVAGQLTARIVKASRNVSC